MPPSSSIPPSERRRSAGSPARRVRRRGPSATALAAWGALAAGLAYWLLPASPEAESRPSASVSALWLQPPAAPVPAAPRAPAALGAVGAVGAVGALAATAESVAVGAGRPSRAAGGEPPSRVPRRPFETLGWSGAGSAGSALLMPRMRLPRTLAPRLTALRGLFGRARPGEHVAVTLSAYCLRGTTRRGRPVRAGIVAADPRVFPLARHVELYVGGRYFGRYLVDDTGRDIKGTRLDIWTPDCDDARRFGMREGVASLVAIDD